MRAQSSQTIWVAFGGAAGAMAREAGVLGLELQPEAGVLLVNVLGSFVIGAVLRFERLLHPSVRDFHAVGFCGGLTTVSTWSWLIVEQLERGSLAGALEFSATTIASCILAAISGRILGRLAEAWWVRRSPDGHEGGA